MSKLNFLFSIALLITIATNSPAYGKSIALFPFTDEEQEMLQNYWADGPEVKESLDYMSSKLKEENNLKDILHAIEMIRTLKKVDRFKFEDQLYNICYYLINNYTGKFREENLVDKNNSRYKPRDVVRSCLIVISQLRTDKSIAHLENLIHPVQNWTQPGLSKIVNQYKSIENHENNKEFFRDIYNIRTNALTYLFLPRDTIAREKIKSIREMIKSFDDDYVYLGTRQINTKEVLLKKLADWEDEFSNYIDKSRWFRRNYK